MKYEVETNKAYMDIEERVAAQSHMKIGIFRALHLGDLMCSVPAFRALRHCYPKAEITLFGLPWAQSFVKRFSHYIDHFKHFPGYPGLPEQQWDATSTIKFISAVQDEKYDLILQMHGNGSVLNQMVALLDATYIAGFFTKGFYHPNNGLFLDYPNDVHEIERHVRLLELINIERVGNELEFPLFDEDWDALQHLHLPLAFKQYVCIHPGARGAWQQWPPEKFALLADYCAAQNMKIVLMGSADELPIVKEVVKHMQYEAIVVAGKTSLGAMAALIKNSCVLIANLTGVAQIAAALETPSVLICMDGEGERWAPINTDLHYTIDWMKNPDINLAFQQLETLLGNNIQRKAA